MARTPSGGNLGARAVTRSVTRSVTQSAPRRNRANRAAILAEARRSKACCRNRANRAAILAERRRIRDSSESTIVREHFRSMRSPRHSTPFHQSPVFKGIRPFNSPIDEELLTTFAYNDLQDEHNFTCSHCGSLLRK